MINLDDGIFDDITPEELWIIVHIAKRMRSWRLKAWPGIKTIAKDCKWSPNTARKWRDSIRDKGIIGMTYVEGSSPIYRFLVPGIGVYTPLHEVDELGEINTGEPLPNIDPPPIPENGSSPLPENGSSPLPKTGSQKDVNKGKRLRSEYSELIKSAIDHLNGLLKSRYSDKNADTIRKLNDIFDEGYTLYDVMRVNTYKVGQWRNDPEMFKYLRPETLYASSHFQGYLNEATMSENIKPKSNSDAEPKQTVSEGFEIRTKLEQAQDYALLLINTYKRTTAIPSIDPGQYEILNDWFESLPAEAGQSPLNYISFLSEVEAEEMELSAVQKSSMAKRLAISKWLMDETYVNDFFRSLFQKRSKAAKS